VAKTILHVKHVELPDEGADRMFRHVQMSQVTSLPKSPILLNLKHVSEVLSRLTGISRQPTPVNGRLNI
jgi:hypothetical protein